MGTSIFSQVIYLTIVLIYLYFILEFLTQLYIFWTLFCILFSDLKFKIVLKLQIVLKITIVSCNLFNNASGKIPKSLSLDFVAKHFIMLFSTDENLTVCLKLNNCL